MNNKRIYCLFLIVIVVMIFGARKGSEIPNNVVINSKPKRKPRLKPRKPRKPRNPRLKPPIPTPIPTPIPKTKQPKIPDPITFPALTIAKPSWRNCQRISCSITGECSKLWKNRDQSIQNCCSDSIYTMLSEVTAVLKDENPVIMYGTLIGSLRTGNDIIPYTPDADIGLTSDVYKRVNIWKSKLNNAGYIVFKSNILRVCKASKTVALHNSAPWGKKKFWFPYMDIYNLQIRNGRVSSTHLPSVRWPTNYIWPIAECKIRGQNFPCPAKGSLGLDSLKKYYGNWRQPQKRGTLIKNIPANFPSSLSSNMTPKYHSDCKDKRVEKVIDIIRSAAVYNISIFPRNGFLLGIVRHGGFLPNEYAKNVVDMDLGMLYSDLSRIQANLQIPSLKYPNKKIKFKIQTMNKAYDRSVWNGFHPKTNEYLPSHCSIYLADEKFGSGSFFYSYNTSSLFYPMYVIQNHNYAKSKNEQKEYAKHNDGLIVLETGLRGKYGEGRLGKLFDVSAFRKTVPMPFYDTLIDIPAGYKSVLQSFYGDDWHVMKTRSTGGVKLWGNPENWSQSDMYKYKAVANIINAFRQVGIDSFLTGGSALGAYRNHGWFSWDKDADLIVVSTDYVKIEQALNTIPIYFYETSTHKNVTADIPSNKGGFGYHVSIPGVGKHKTPYIDLWLFEKNKDNKLQCKGFNNGCQRWCQQHSKKTCKPISRNWIYPFHYVPYGPYLMPTIRKPYLDFVYGKSWPSKCGDGKAPCSDRYRTDVFVFSSKNDDGNRVETAKIGDVVKHRFVIKGGEYQVDGVSNGKKIKAGNILKITESTLPPKQICKY